MAKHNAAAGRHLRFMVSFLRIALHAVDLPEVAADFGLGVSCRRR